MQAVDFNSDMGEGFGPWTIGDGVDAELMAYISSANIATGFHAGDPGTMRRTVARAKQLGVAIGAHPGLMCCRAMPWAERTNSCTPSMASSSLIAVVTADWEMFR